MCELTVDFWRKAMNAPIQCFEATAIKEGFMPSTVYRVRLESADETIPRSVILKCVRPPWANDPYGSEREYRVYTDLLPHIPIPQAERYFTCFDETTQHTQIVMQDLSGDHVFYPETHAWTGAEAQGMMRALAQLHSTGETLGTAERPYMMSRLCKRWTPPQMRQIFSDLAGTDWLAARMERGLEDVDKVLAELPVLERMAAQEPLTLVHYDVYPPNVALTRDAVVPEAVLIDWAAATADVAEIDLAFLFQQPYKSDRLLDWRTTLRYYWDERLRLTGRAYAWDERCAVFRYARLQALFTTMLAIHRAWEKCIRENLRIAPDSPDPYMRFFDAMLTEVLDTLEELTVEPL